MVTHIHCDSGVLEHLQEGGCDYCNYNTLKTSMNTHFQDVERLVMCLRKVIADVVSSEQSL
jgi:hypothetical protein